MEKGLGWYGEFYLKRMSLLDRQQTYIVTRRDMSISSDGEEPVLCHVNMAAVLVL